MAFVAVVKATLAQPLALPDPPALFPTPTTVNVSESRVEALTTLKRSSKGFCVSNCILNFAREWRNTKKQRKTKLYIVLCIQNITSCLFDLFVSVA